ncbi:MAG TPA: DNA mismatch repair protein MutS, partial [Myxococcaceae bacterium]|nr:DNA mismatch repair protein MutS [Myxococcaceae bacterium]
LLVPAAMLLVARRGIVQSFEGLELGQRGADRLARALLRVEQEPFTSPELRALAHDTDRVIAPSTAMRQLARLSSLAEQRRNQMHVVVNVLTLWDLHVFFRLDDWRRRNGRDVAGWLDRLADVEALACLGGYLHDRPDLVMPEVVETGPRFVGERLSHPLLDDAVPNDVSLERPGQLLLVTGSNMSGKSTLLRAIGLNAVVALAGGPVSAGRLTLSALHTWTSMRVQDSLEQGVSFFYAEVRRLKQVLEGAARHPGTSLVLVDEMLLGTNTRERRLASEEVLHLLVQTGCIGAVTTHDLSLAELARLPDSTLVPVHFQDVLEDGRMRFDYTLRQGVVQSTNALRVLALAGIPVRDDARE